MILWRNSMGDEENCSYGYKWFTTKPEALKHVEDNPDLYGEWDDRQIAVEFKFDCRSKKNIVAFLNYNCAYPDNG